MNPSNPQPPNNSTPVVPPFEPASQTADKVPPTVQTPPPVTPPPAVPPVVAQQNPPTISTPPPPTVPAMTTPPANHPKPSKLLLVLVLILFALFGVLGFILLKNSSVSQAPPTQPLPQTNVSITPPTPTPSPTDEEEVENVDTSSPAADLQDVKTDLQGL